MTNGGLWSRLTQTHNITNIVRCDMDETFGSIGGDLCTWGAKQPLATDWHSRPCSRNRNEDAMHSPCSWARCQYVVSNVVPSEIDCMHRRRGSDSG